MSLGNRIRRLERELSSRPCPACGGNADDATLPTWVVYEIDGID